MKNDKFKKVFNFLCSIFVGVAFCFSFHSYENESYRDTPKSAVADVVDFNENLYYTYRVRNQIIGTSIFKNGITTSAKSLYVSHFFDVEYIFYYVSDTIGFRLDGMKFTFKTIGYLDSIKDTFEEADLFFTKTYDLQLNNYYTYAYAFSRVNSTIEFTVINRPSDIYGSSTFVASWIVQGGDGESVLPLSVVINYANEDTQVNKLSGNYRAVYGSTNKTAASLLSVFRGTDILLQVEDVYKSLYLNYSKGYNNGYSDGYDVGHDDGASDWYDKGYEDGYNEGFESDSFALTVFNGIFGVALMPINMFLQLFNFDLLGINIRDLVSAVLTAVLTLYIVKEIL